MSVRCEAEGRAGSVAKPGNVGGAKEPDFPALGTGQPARGGAGA